MRPPRGVLLFGPPGTGKTSLARAAALSCGACVVTISGPELTSQVVGESEAALSGAFAEAVAKAPSLVVIDEVDVLCPARRNAASEADARLTSTLLALLDGVDAKERVVVLATTNRPQALDAALRRPGRLDREVEVGVPNEGARAAILRVLLRRAGGLGDVGAAEVEAVAAQAHGFVGADLEMLVKDATLRAFRRMRRAEEAGETAGGLRIGAEDLRQALQATAPSSLREVAVDVPKTRWEDIGGMEGVKAALREALEWPVRHRAAFDALGIAMPRGVLLYGPPGCSKTLMARALAHEGKMNFLAVKGPELLSMWLGESERALQQLFRRARAAAPSLVFFDEVDALAAARGGMGAGGAGGGNHDSAASERMLSQLLAELDGVQPMSGVIVIAATNRPDILDPALLRPGRFDRLVYVPPPDKRTREAIFEITLRDVRIASRSGEAQRAELVSALGALSAGFSGAECAAVVQEATLAALTESRDAEGVTEEHLMAAVAGTEPQITGDMIHFYEGFQRGASAQGAAAGDDAEDVRAALERMSVKDT